MEEQKTKFDWKRSLITIALVLFTAAVVGGTVWYVMDQNAKNEKEATDKSIQALENTVNKLKEEAEKVESTATTENSTSETPISISRLFVQDWIDSAPPTGEVNGTKAKEAKSLLSEELQNRVTNSSPNSISGGIALLMGVQDIPDRGFTASETSNNDTNAKIRITLNYSGGTINQSGTLPKDFTLIKSANKWVITNITTPL